MRPIRIDLLYPPISWRCFDYCATADGYEPGHVIGYGRTAEEAAEELRDQLVDR